MFFINRKRKYTKSTPALSFEMPKANNTSFRVSDFIMAFLFINISLISRERNARFKLQEINIFKKMEFNKVNNYFDFLSIYILFL